MNLDKNCNSNNEKSTVILSVTEISQNNQYAQVTVATPAKNNCQTCASGNGCQSFSIYQLIFANRPLKINNQNYHQGQQLSATFPNRLLQQTLYFLLGLPLLGFILGAIIGSFTHELLGFALGLSLAIITYFFTKKQTKKLISKHLQLTQIQP